MNSTTTASKLEHGSFVIERVLDAPPAQVFSCWSSAEAKRRWFFCDECGLGENEMDFRVGGREVNRSGPEGGPVHLYDARYEDIIPNERIVLSYAMTLGEVRISASLLTLEFLPEGAGTRMIFTEQMVVLDDRYPVSSREEGTRQGLKNLDAELLRRKSL